MRGHAAALAADKADEVGGVDHAIGALARIGADHPDGQWMVAGNGIFAVERGCDRNLQRLRKRNQFGRGARGANSAARHDHRAQRLLQMRKRRPHARLVGARAKRRHARELRLAQRLHLRLLGVDLSFVAAKLQMHGAGRAGGRHAKGLAHHVGKARDVIDGGVELGHRLECRHVVDLLIDLAELALRFTPAGHGDDGRMRERGIAQAGGEVERADHLRHGDAGPPAGASVPICHVGCRLFAVHVQPLDVGAALHDGKGLAQHRRHMKDVGYAIALEHVGEAFRPAHSSIVSEHGEPLRKLFRVPTAARIERRRNPERSLGRCLPTTDALPIALLK